MIKRLIVGVACISILAGCSGSSSTPSEKTVGAQGIDRGNGTDYTTTIDRMAWYVGAKRTIKYCVVTDPMFGVSKEVSESIIETEFKTWDAYARSHEGKSSIDITMTGSLQADCASADLRFYLGNRNAEVDKYLPDSGSRLAAAFRTSYDSDAGWGSGFIWVTKNGSVDPGPLQPFQISLIHDPVFPNWNAPDTLKAIIRHELGHVFGTEHVEGTIMDANLADSILNYTQFPENLVGIDCGRNLLPNDTPQDGVLGVPTDVNSNFALVVGRAPSGTVRASVRFWSLSISDDVSTTVVNFERFGPATGDVAFAKVSGVFEYFSHDGGRKNWVGSARSHTPAVWYGRMTTATGKVLLVSLENSLSTSFERSGDGSNASPWRSSWATGTVIKLLTEAGPKILFATSVR